MEQMIFSPIPLEDFKHEIRLLVRSELKDELKQLIKRKQPDEIITRKEAASILGISLHTLHDWTKSGKIPAYRIASRVRYKRGEIEASLRQIKSH